jgi:hypothetical protein
MDMCVGCFVVLMLVPMNLEARRPYDRPDPNSHEQEPDKELSPTGPGFEIYESPQDKADASDDGNTDSMTETPEHTGSPRSCWVINGDGGQRGEMVNTRKHMESTCREAC